MSESLNHSLKRFVQNTDSSSNEPSEVLMSESLNHSFKRFVQTLIHPVMKRVKY